MTQPFFASLEEARELAPLSPAAGRLPAFIAAGRRLQAEFPEADLRLPVSGPFSIATSLLGLDELITSVALAPEQVRESLPRLIPGQIAFCEAIRAAGLDVAFFESAAAPPLLSPRQFRAVELPALKEIITKVAAAVGHPVPCIIGGDTEPILDAIMETGTGFVICPAETNREKFLSRMTRYPEVKVRVNLDPGLYTRGHERRDPGRGRSVCWRSPRAAQPSSRHGRRPLRDAARELAADTRLCRRDRALPTGTARPPAKTMPEGDS